MDLTREIDASRNAAARIVADLFAMLGLTAGVVLGRIRRELHRDILRVLRPAESAVRRLIAVLARGVIVKARPPRPAPTSLARATPGQQRLSFRLFDARPPLRLAKSPAKTGPRPQPRISFFGDGEARRISLSREPRPKEEHVDPSHLLRRLEAVRAALANLPHQARRLARALARRQRSPRLKLKGPLRPGHPPGFRRRARREVDHVLHRCDWLAREALPPDTS